MLYDFIGRLAQSGGEIALAALLAISVVNVALAGDRLWTLLRGRVDLDQLIKGLTPLLKSKNWRGACTAVQAFQASPAAVAFSGLSHVDLGPGAVRAAMRSTAARQRLYLETHVGLLKALGYAALSIGVLGGVFDWWQLLSQMRPNGMGKTLHHAATAFALAPLAAGLLVATPALVLSSLLASHAQRVGHQMDQMAEWILAHVEGGATYAENASASRAAGLPARAA